MKKCFTCDTVNRISEDISKAFDKGCKNPVIVRKKLELKDVYYRKKQPDTELFRFEVAFDFDLCLIACVAAAVILMIFVKLMRSADRRKVKKLAKLKESNA